jgi:hypothetical protein
MITLRLHIVKAFLAVAVAIVLTGSASAQTGEIVAVLYAHDGDALYRIDPNSGVLTKIGDLDRHFGPGGSPTTYASMVYDGKEHKLYVVAVWGDGSSPKAQMIVEVDPQTAALRKVADLPLYPPLNLSYDASTEQLYAIQASPPVAWLPIQAVNPQTGVISLTDVQSFGSGEDGNTSFFDVQGHFWQYSVSGTWGEYATLGERQFPSADLVHTVDGRLPYTPGGWGDQTLPALWPYYASFSFDPYTWVLFATFKTYTNAFPFAPDAVFHTSLCTLDVTTGEPAKVIATYDKPNWSLVIAWGVSQ